MAKLQGPAYQTRHTSTGLPLLDQGHKHNADFFTDACSRSTRRRNRLVIRFYVSEMVPGSLYGGFCPSCFQTQHTALGSQSIVVTFHVLLKYPQRSSLHQELLDAFP